MYGIKCLREIREERCCLEIACTYSDDLMDNANLIFPFCFKQFLEATFNKTSAEWPLTSHFINHPRKKNKTTGEIKTNYSAAFSYGLLHMYTSVRQTNKDNIYQPFADTRCSIEDLPRAMDDWDRRRESMESMLSTWLKLSTQNYTTPDDDQKSGRKRLCRRCGTIP